MVKRERDSSGNSNSKLIWAIVIIVVIAVATILLFRLKTPELAPIGTENDDLIGKSLTIEDPRSNSMFTVADYPISGGSGDRETKIHTNVNRLKIASGQEIIVDGSRGIKLNTFNQFSPSDFNAPILITAGGDFEAQTTKDFRFFAKYGFNGSNPSPDLLIYNDGIRTEGISYFATPGKAFREVWGSVSSTGVKTGGSTGWTVARTSAGSYTITPSPAFSSAPFPIATSAQANTARFITTQSVTGNSFQVRAYDTNGSLQDTSFNFNVKGYS